MIRESLIAAALAAAVYFMTGLPETIAQAPQPTVTFNKDVLPVLQKNCQGCHRPGQIAPMSLLTYKDARPWAKAMKNAVVTGTMPPWFADPNYGHFLNERRLKQSEIDTIAKWADGGAPEGDAKDVLPPVQWPDGGWQIKPDYIVEGPTYDVPPKGIVEWTWFVVPGGFTKDTWVTSIEVLPSQLAVTHHVCLSYVQHSPEVQYNVPILPRGVIQRDAEGNEIRAPRGQRGGAVQGGQAAGQRREAQGGAAFPGALGVVFGRSAGTSLIEECYEPGRPPADFRPYNAAKLIPAGTDIAVNVHYTPNGTPVTDHVRIGFTLAKEPPKRRYIAMSSSAPSDPAQFAIPPNNGNWEAPPAVVTFDHDVELVGLMPHMHVRGKAARFDLEYPDGKKETILNVPRYDFNWQLWYDTSIKLPKGTTMKVFAWYDNSLNNKFNPNPNATVYYGDQTWEEMHFPSYGLVLDDPSIDPRRVIRSPLQARPPGN
ncbi:MAG: thiol-disulfide isomerase [Acidobacteria bacterium]|nr:MAG: thiol-disulfide isomerase [Acidobacteriota bacterium]